MKINKAAWKRNGAYALFWIWHIIYTILALAVFLPYLLVPMIQDVVKGITPWHYLIYTSVIVLLPFISMFLGAISFAKQPKNLLKYFYGFEMPLLLLFLLRIMTLREPHAGMMWLWFNLLIALATWMVFLWWQNKDKKALPFKNNHWALSASTVLAMTGLYLGILLVLFAIPAAIALVKGALDTLVHLFKYGIDWHDFKFLLHPLFYLGTVFFFFTASLLIVLPIVMVRLYLGQFIQRFRALLNTPKATAAMAIVLSVVVINSGVFVLLNKANEAETLQLLDNKIAQPEYEKELLSQSATIREDLLNAYIARYRYVSPEGTSNVVGRMYRDVLDLKRSNIIVQWPQAIFNTLAAPFLYQDDSWQTAKAKRYYEKFFDAPIQKAERDAILHAIKYTWETDGNEAGLLNAASHYVHLNQQNMTIKEQQGVVTVNVSQQLENKTYEQQEVVLHFSLPEDAVMTGVWLSNSAQEPHQYPFVVAPKGAAQAVYKAEVKRRIDPALLEQTGLYQYRLRVYPIPAKSRHTSEAEPLYMQFEYQTLVQPSGQWAVPQLLEKRNIFWDDETQFRINGVEQATQDESVWFSADIAKNHSFTFRGIDNLRFKQPQRQTQIYAIARQHDKEQQFVQQNQRPLRILIDGSYSMAQHKAHLLSHFQQLHDLGVSFNSYFCRQQCTALTHFSELDNQVFYGNSQIHDHIAASMNIEETTQPAAMLVLTDEGSYELAAEQDISTLNSPVPLWLVHITNTLPYAYDDKVLDLLYRSKGGVGRSMMDVLMRMNHQGIKQAAGIDNMSHILGVSDQYIWVEQTPEAGTQTEHNAALEPIMAAYQIKHLTRSMDMSQLDNLDAIHAIAKQQGIVSHYSSMLVLVNDRQKEALKKAEQQDDRFEREVETGEQNTSTPSDVFSVPAVPEPEEWALFLIILGLLTIAMRRRQQV